MRETFYIVVNGEKKRVEAPPRMPLLWVLRDLLNVTGPKYGCGLGLCGACTVLEGSTSLRSCETTIKEADGRSFTTIEGLAPDGSHPVQRAWIEEDVAQCGYCQGGMILETAALLAEDPTPDDKEIDDALFGILCRCGTYDRARKAVHRAAVLAVEDPGKDRD